MDILKGFLYKINFILKIMRLINFIFFKGFLYKILIIYRHFEYKINYSKHSTII